jgi:ribonuclease HI
MAENKWRAWFDGAADPNPGAAGIGALLIGPSGERVEIAESIGFGTNNEAEYKALIAILKAAIELGAAELDVRGDSKLVVEQVSGRWAVKSERLMGLRSEAAGLLARIQGARLSWIPRDDNAEADALSKKAIGKDADEENDWGNLTDIGTLLGVSAVMAGRRLDAIGLREGKKPSKTALEAGIGRIVENRFGHDIQWHSALAAAAIQSGANLHQ